MFIVLWIHTYNRLASCYLDVELDYSLRIGLISWTDILHDLEYDSSRIYITQSDCAKLGELGAGRRVPREDQE